MLAGNTVLMVFRTDSLIVRRGIRKFVPQLARPRPKTIGPAERRSADRH